MPLKQVKKKQKVSVDVDPTVTMDLPATVATRQKLGMKIVSWNINGIKSVMDKDKDGVKGAGADNVMKALVEEVMPDVICLQEVRCSPSVKLLETFATTYGYESFYMNCSKEKKGYSGTAVLSKIRPVREDCVYDFGDMNTDVDMNNEGRIITVEYEKLVLITVYTPNSKADLARLEYRVNAWEPTFRAWINRWQQNTGKPVVVCGDLNVAHREIDLKNPWSNKEHAGFTLKERSEFNALLRECDLVDTFRELHPSTEKYSWWSNFAQSRARNVGWRIDYVLASKTLQSHVKEADILTEFKGSDHAPVVIDIIYG